MTDATAAATPPAAPAAPAPPAALTQQQAAARLAELRETPEWGAKVLAQDAGALSEFHALSKLVSQSDPIDIIMSGEAAGLPNTGFNGQPSLSATAKEIPALRSGGMHDDIIRELLEGKVSTPELLEAANALKATCHSNPEWVKRYLAGNYEAIRESRAISKALALAPI
jgi:hypothetical protein